MATQDLKTKLLEMASRRSDRSVIRMVLQSGVVLPPSVPNCVKVSIRVSADLIRVFSGDSYLPTCLPAV